MTDPKAFVIEDAPPAPGNRKAKAAAIVLTPLLLATALLWARGSWIHGEARDPASSSEGVVAQVVRVPEGKCVRCSVLVDAAPDAVWAAVTDYDHFPDTFDKLKDVKITREPGDLVRFSGTAVTPLEAWSYGVLIHHETKPDRRVAWWDETGTPFATNRGSWTITSAPGGKTLLVYQLEIKIRFYPNFVVRNVLLSKLPAIVGAIAQKVAKK